MKHFEQQYYIFNYGQYSSSHKTKKDFIASINKLTNLDKQIERLKNKKEISFEFDITHMTNTFSLSTSYYFVLLSRRHNEVIIDKEYHLSTGDAVKYTNVSFPFNEVNTNNIISFIEQIKKMIDEN